MKIVIGIVMLVIGLIAGHGHQAPSCVDPNANVPIDCSLLK